ncbi:MAG: NADP oxidoreductase, partial [Myxococcaceae bacterium]|nr:NADP oxidoreductase [Myxococcaceae bacterium]
GMSVDDAAASVCPVGVILKKRVGFSTPIGQRPHDVATPRQQVEGKEGA